MLREESLLVFCFQSGGILRFAQNDNQSTISATCEACATNPPQRLPKFSGSKSGAGAPPFVIFQRVGGWILRRFGTGGWKRKSPPLQKPQGWATQRFIPQEFAVTRLKENGVGR